MYGQHRRREIRPRSRFIEVPKRETRHSAGFLRQKTLKMPANRGLLGLGTSKNLLRGRICQLRCSPYTGYVSPPHCQLHPLATVFRSSRFSICLLIAERFDHAISKIDALAGKHRLLHNQIKLLFFRYFADDLVGALLKRYQLFVAA